MDNIFLPKAAVIRDIIEENSQIKTFIISFQDEMYNRRFSYDPGQFMMVSMPHCGEAPISISSTPTRPGTLHLSVRQAGKLTGAMFGLQKGDVVGLRGPYGRPFPIDIIGRDMLFVAGGIGLAPLRSVINFSLDQGGDFGRKTILYGSRSPGDVAFQDDIKLWQKRQGLTCLLTVDQADSSWRGAEGVVTNLLDNVEIDSENGIALVCGPPIMIRFTLAKLATLGFRDENIWTTMERHMKCGIGTCGHCHMDGKMVCKDGPVFNMAELRHLEISEFAD